MWTKKDIWHGGKEGGDGVSEDQFAIVEIPLWDFLIKPHLSLTSHQQQFTV